MRRFFAILFVLLLIGIAIAAWLFIGPATRRTEKQYLYVTDRATAREEILQQINGKELLNNPKIFALAADRAKVWNRVRAGRFEVLPGDNLYQLLRRLRRNEQSPVRLVINKVRTKEQLAALLARSFELDSTPIARYLLRNDSLEALDTDTNKVMSLIIPDTYQFVWTGSTRKILSRLKEEQEAFWRKNNRLQKAEQKGLSPLQVYTIASIVDEETNKNDEKGNVASVYINRYRRGMNLGADPTIKYALRDFGLRRILYGHLNVESPYNTYRNAGLPPGPICTPGKASIDAVLNAPTTSYLFFVARDDFSGYHKFSETYAEHQAYAKQYQAKLDEYMKRKQGL